MDAATDTYFAKSQDLNRYSLLPYACFISSCCHSCSYKATISIDSQLHGWVNACLVLTSVKFLSSVSSKTE